MSKKDQIKKLYIEGKSPTDIASLAGCSRQTVYHHKNADFKEGRDWDELRYANAIDPKDTKVNEKEFLATLINQFKTELQSLEEIEDPAKRLFILDRFAKTYYKLKAPMKNDCKSAVIEAASKAIYAISDLALDKEEQIVINFLTEHADEIIQKVIA